MVGKLKIRFRESRGNTYLKEFGTIQYNVTLPENYAKNTVVISTMQQIASQLVQDTFVQPVVRYDLNMLEYEGD